MNKQELIEKWESKGGASVYEMCTFPIRPSETEMYIAGYGVARKEIIDDLKQLDEPEKPTVQQLVADWFEDNFEELEWELGGVLVNAFNTNRNERSDFQDWLVDTTNYPIETLIRMKLFGYEVEEEPKYRVIFPNPTEPTFEHCYLTEKGGICYGKCFKSIPKFTEKEIKAMDERYWLFAVPVEKV